MDKEADDGADDQCGDDRPLPEADYSLTTGQRQNHRHRDHAGVEYGFDDAELLFELRRDGAHQAFAGDVDRLRHHLQRDAEAERDTSGQQQRDPGGIRFDRKPGEQEHHQVDHAAEQQRDRNLEVLRRCELFFQQQQLAEDQRQVEYESESAEGKRKDFAQHIGQTGNRRRAESRLGDQADAEAGRGHPAQKYRITPYNRIAEHEKYRWLP